MAVAVDNALHSQEAQALQQQLAHERDRLQLLLEVTNSVISNLELRDVLRAISATLRRVMHCDVAGVQLLEAEHHQLRVYALDFPDSQGFIQEELLMPLEGSLPGKALPDGAARGGRPSRPRRGQLSDRWGGSPVPLLPATDQPPASSWACWASADGVSRPSPRRRSSS